MRRGRWAATAGAALTALACAAPAQAEPAAGVTADGALVTFDTARPGTFTSIRPIAGLQPGEYVGGIDYRFVPRPGEALPDAAALYAIGVVHGATDTLRTYRIDTGTGVATPVGEPIAGVATSAEPAAYGVDFNPNVDRIRVVNSADANFRVNPNRGTLTVDTSLPAPVLVAAAAYDRLDADPATPTTLYALHSPAQLLTIGGIDGTPSPNTGSIGVIGGFGFSTVAPETLNADIAPGGTAYATATPGGGRAGLYTANLATGGLSPLGELALPLTGLAVLPPSSAQLTASAQTVAEGGTATFTVTRSGLLNDTASVRWATADGSATSADYAPTTGTLVFAPGVASASFTVTTRQDAEHEQPETVTVSLGDPAAPLTLGAPASATLTIADDDARPAPPTRPGPDDRIAPRTTLTAPRTVTLAAFVRRGVTVSARTNEAATLVFALEASPRSARLAASFPLTLATRTLRTPGAGRRTVTLKPQRPLVGRPRKAFKVRIRMTATDTRGNVARAVTRTVTVKPTRARARRRRR